MTSSRYILGVLALLALAVLLVAGFHIWLDPYGLFRSAKPGTLSVWANEARDKYLLSQRYVPEHFEAVMIGASISDNMPTGRAPDLRLYNLSLNGSNIMPLAHLLDEVLDRRQLRFVVICFDPYITRTNAWKFIPFTEQTVRSQLGSIDSLRGALKLLSGRSTPMTDGYGYQDFSVTSRRTAEDVARLRAEFLQNTPKHTPIDPVAFARLEEILARLRNEKVRIIGYYYPNRTRQEARMSKSIREFQEATRRLFTEDDLLIDYTMPEYAAFRDDDRHYMDERHLSVLGGEVLMDDLADRIRRYLSDTNRADHPNRLKGDQSGAGAKGSR